MDGVPPPDVLGAGLGDTDVAHLALLHKLLQHKAEVVVGKMVGGRCPQVGW